MPGDPPGTIFLSPMKNARFLLPLAALLTLPAHAQLVITEINSNGGPSDFWELTNFGESAVDVGGYKWDDDSQNPNDPSAVTIPAGTSIAAGESILFVVGDAAGFRAAWDLDASVQIVTGGPGLGSNDAVFLFNTLNQPVTSLNYAAGGFTRSNGQASLGGHAGASAGGTATQSLILDPNFQPPSSPRYTFATGANFDTYASTSAGTYGSPGLIGEAGVNAPPAFVGPVRTYWRTGLALTNSQFRVNAVDADAGQSVTLSVVEKPAWLTLTSAGAGSYRLGGTPPAPGDYSFTVRATDNAPVPASTDQTFTLTAFPATSPIILNEYNAVGPNDFIRGGDAGQDGDGVSPGPSDTFFGRIPGNGGQWVEFAIVGSGTPGSTVDMRGWTIEILSPSGTRSLRLSDDDYWSNVIAGTILTFTAADTARGGLDTAIHKTSAMHAGGYVWTNVWAGDPILVSQSESDVSADLGIGSDDTRFVVKNNTGDVIYGPSGEGVASEDTDGNNVPDSLLGVNSEELLRLQADPNPGLDPLFAPYNDGDSSSTFGAPNTWGSGPSVQNFGGYSRPNSPPRFTSLPVTQARGDYSYAVTTSDPNGQSITLTAPILPEFLTFTPGASGTGTLSLNRPLTLEDAGEHLVRLVANDGGATPSSTPQSFVLNVFHDEPSVILNEFNAVSAGNFLNGGNATTDSDGGAASDGHFGRVAGNGGRWFELVVVGNGAPSTVDLRGWSIEIGTSSGGEFRTSNVLKLSQDSTWSAIPAGTILTFIDRNSANGGLDTEIFRRDRLSTEGDAWTNVWIGDATLLDYSGEAENGYTVGAGTVSGIRIDNSDTQFVLKNAAGERVFGPAGEGIAPLSGVGSTEIFELEGDPSPSISPLVAADESGGGYTDGSASSTFGWPNTWSDTGGDHTQDFSAFIATATPFESWAASFGLNGADAEPTADPDGDGRDNFTEYAFGGDPSVADGSPVPQVIGHSETTLTWQYVRRDDDPGLAFVHEASPDLEDWQEIPAGELNVSTAPHPSLAGHVLVTVEVAASTADSRFVRARAE